MRAVGAFGAYRTGMCVAPRIDFGAGTINRFAGSTGEAFAIEMVPGRRGFMIKRLFFALLFLGVVVGGVVGFNLFRDQMIETVFAEMQPPPVTVSVIEAEAASWRPGIDAIGTARAAQGVDLAIEAGGVVREILFDANERVDAGQLLLQIDDRIEDADLAAAQSALDLSQTQLQRAEQLRERGVTASTNVDIAAADAINARSQVVKLTAVMEQKALEAPFAGVIGIPQTEVGEYVTPGTVYATLQDLDTMRVEFSIPEQQIRLVAIGQNVTVSSEIGGTTLAGSVSAIEPRIDPNTRLVTIRADVSNPDGEINPGQFLRVRVELPEEEGVVALPQTVLTSNLYGDSVYVVRADGGDEDAAAEDALLRVEQVFVTAGRRSGNLVEILDGIAPGDRVVTAGQNRLAGGAVVVIDNSVSPISALPTN